MFDNFPRHFFVRVSKSDLYAPEDHFEEKHSVWEKCFKTSTIPGLEPRSSEVNIRVQKKTSPWNTFHLWRKFFQTFFSFSVEFFQVFGKSRATLQGEDCKKEKLFFFTFRHREKFCGILMEHIPPRLLKPLFTCLEELSHGSGFFQKNSTNWKIFGLWANSFRVLARISERDAETAL